MCHRHPHTPHFFDSDLVQVLLDLTGGSGTESPTALLLTVVSSNPPNPNP